MKTIDLSDLHYVENRIKAARVRAIEAGDTHVHVEADHADNWLGWRLVVGRNGPGSVRVDGGRDRAIEDVLDALQAGGWMRIGP